MMVMHDLPLEEVLDHLLGKDRHNVFNPDRDLMIHLLKELRTMALDLTKLSAAVAKVQTDVDALVAAHSNAAAAAAAQQAADQAAVDQIVPTVEQVSAKLDAALAATPA